MPKQVQLPETPAFDFEAAPLAPLLELVEEAAGAAEVNFVVRTFDRWAATRRQDHEGAWAKADERYNGILEKKYWHNSKVERANLSSHLVFELVETAHPLIVSELFPDENWFGVTSKAGEMGAKVAKHIESVIKDKLAENTSFGGIPSSVEQEISAAAKTGLLYGTGVCLTEWDHGRNGPTVSFVHVRDVYFDPKAASPSADSGRGVIIRREVPVDILKSWRGTPGMDVPADDVLYSMANTSNTADNQPRDEQDAVLGMLPRSGEFDTLPIHRPLEVLSYYTNREIIFILERRHRLFKAENPYGFVPVVAAPCYEIPGRLPGKSFVEAVSDMQAYADGLFNGRLDELALALHPPRGSKRRNLNPSQEAWAPGAVIHMDNPKEDINMFPIAGATTRVSEELDHIFQRANRIVGISPLASGMPAPSNANRTQGGMRMQMQGTQLRIWMFVWILENYLLVPLLHKIARMIEVHDKEAFLLPPEPSAPPPQQPVPGPGQPPGMPQPVPGQPVPGQPPIEFPAAPTEPATAPNSGPISPPPLGYRSGLSQAVKFVIGAADRMLRREQIMQAFPLILQSVTSGGLVQQLASMGKTVDFAELFRMLLDGARITGNYVLFRDLTPQEQQAMQQPPPQVVARAQEVQQTNQTKLQLAQIKAQADQAPDPSAQMKMQADMAKHQMEIERGQQKLSMERELAQIKLQMEEMKLALEMQRAQLDAQRSAEEHQMGIQRSHTEHQLEMQQTIESAMAQKRASEINPAPKKSPNKGDTGAAESQGGGK